MLACYRLDAVSTAECDMMQWHWQQWHKMLFSMHIYRQGYRKCQWIVGLNAIFTTRNHMKDLRHTLFDPDTVKTAL